MPKSLNEILEHAEDLAAAFESFEPTEETELEAGVYNALRTAVLARADAERAVVEAVVNARRVDFSWALIGTLIGTSGEAARQRYGRAATGEKPTPRAKRRPAATTR